METARSRHVVLGITLLAVLAPFGVALVAFGRIGNDLHPWGDLALIETSVRAVGARPVLLGPYSQWGWRHPGPLYAYLLAVPYRLLGSHYRGLFVGSTLIGASAAVGIVLVAARRAGRALALWAAAVVLVFLGAVGELAVDAWNPRVTVLPFALALMLAWSVACGDIWALPFFATVASFVVQSHVEYTPTLTIVAVATLGIAIWDASRRGTDRDESEGRRRALRRAGVVTGAVLVLVWMPSLVDQGLHDPGNLRAMVSFFTSRDGDHSLGDGVAVVVQHLGVIPARVFGGEHLAEVTTSSAASWPSIVSMAAAVFVVSVGAWRRVRDLALLIGMVAVAAVVAVISVSRIVGPVSRYLVVWTAGIGIPLWIAVGWALARACIHPADRPLPAKLRIAGLAVATAGVVVLAFLAGKALDGVGTPAPTTKMATALTKAVDERVPRGSARVVVTIAGVPSLVPWAQGLLDGLEARGRDVRVERSAAIDASLWPWERTSGRRGATLVQLRSARDAPIGSVRIGDVAIEVVPA